MLVKFIFLKEDDKKKMVKNIGKDMDMDTELCTNIFRWNIIIWLIGVGT